MSKILRTPAERERARMKARAVVYFIETVGAPFVKIGWAVDVDKRMAQLQCGCPLDLHLAATLPGSRDIESHYHRRFKSYRVRSDGEWFRLAGELSKFVESIRGRFSDGIDYEHPRAQKSRRQLSAEEIRQVLDSTERFKAGDASGIIDFVFGKGKV